MLKSDYGNSRQDERDRQDTRTSLLPASIPPSSAFASSSNKISAHLTTPLQELIERAALYAETSCDVKIPIIGTFFYKNVFMQVIPV
jgi:hypothetical protein